MVPPKSFSPFMTRRVISLVAFANTKGLVYKPSTGYSADKVSLDNNRKPLSDNLYNLDPGFFV